MQNTALAPITSTERLQVVNILRGFALFGVLLVNLLMFAWPMQILTTREWANPLDKLAYGFINMFGNYKFFPIFSFLFGLGLFLLMERVEARGGRFVPLYLRRMAILLTFGRWRLSHFRYGPLEWLWRSLTYLDWQPIRLKSQPGLGELK